MPSVADNLRGGLDRFHNAKREVVVYDYVDGNVPVLARMAAKRRSGYQAIGYRLTSADDLFVAHPRNSKCGPLETRRNSRA